VFCEVRLQAVVLGAPELAFRAGPARGFQLGELQRSLVVRLTADTSRGVILWVKCLTKTGRLVKSYSRRRPVAELWNIRPSRGSIGEGDPPSRSSTSQATFQHRVTGGRGCHGEACR